MGKGMMMNIDIFRKIRSKFVYFGLMLLLMGLWGGGCSLEPGTPPKADPIELEYDLTSKEGFLTALNDPAFLDKYLGRNDRIMEAVGATRPALQVRGKYIVNENSDNFKLIGVALADIMAIYQGHRRHRKPFTIYDIIDLVDRDWKHANHVRLGLHPKLQNWTDETGRHGWCLDPPIMSHNRIVQEIIVPGVNYAISKGFYVIIDWHVISNVTGYSFEEMLSFWHHVAPYFANHPNVIFEIANEPGSDSWNDWAVDAQKIVDGIRTGIWPDGLPGTRPADNLILVGGPTWSRILPRYFGDNLITGGNIAYVCHLYPGGGGSPTEIDTIISYISKRAPIVMTEWGFEGGGPVPTTGTKTAWAIPFKNKINEYDNVSWTAWCFDYTYHPYMFDMEWNLMGNGATNVDVTNIYRVYADQGIKTNGALTPEDTPENYQGYFVKEWMEEYPMVTPAPLPLGDVNGDRKITIDDAVGIARYYYNDIPAAFHTGAADVDQNGIIDFCDALWIAKYLKEKIIDLPKVALGDINTDGAVDALDAEHIRVFADTYFGKVQPAGIWPVDTPGFYVNSVINAEIMPCPAAGDTDADGDIDYADATLVEQYVNGEIVELPGRETYENSLVYLRW